MSTAPVLYYSSEFLAAIPSAFRQFTEDRPPGSLTPLIKRTLIMAAPLK